MVAGTLDARRLVFVDEMGTNISLSRLYGWAKKGERAYCSVPRNRGKNTTLLSSMSMEGMGPSLAVEGATNREIFETYVGRVLAPMLRRGQLVVMDNLTAHKGERVRELIEQQGVASCCTCPPTHRTSTPSKRLSARSSTSYAKPRPVAGKVWSRRWAQRSRRSVPKMLVASSNTAATVR
jgi:hypothetical protein